MRDGVWKHLSTEDIGAPRSKRGKRVREGDGVVYLGHRRIPERSWHSHRHTFATHAARFGVNPWRLQAWLGHWSISMTMRYVHHVEEHHRPIPDEVLSAQVGVSDPDARTIAMLGARSGVVRGNAVATARSSVSST